jgi:predicted porin
MQLLRIFSILIIYTGILSASTQYVDYDLDGVDDSIDLCPNTPFDVLVDAHGCNIEKKALPGKLLIQAGVNRHTDAVYENTTLLNFFADYSYQNWDISLSSATYNTSNLTTIVDAEDDLFLTVGYTFHKEGLTTKIMGGTKFASMEDSGTDRDNDWYAAVNLDYTLNNKVNLFGYYSYTISGDSSTIDYKNFHTVSVGAGYSITPLWYSSLSYNYASVYYSGGESYQSLSWFNAYMLTKSVYISLNYAYGLNDTSYDHTFSFAIGAFFE